MKSEHLRYLKILIVLAIFVVAAAQRIQFFGQVGKDIYAFQRAISDFFEGVNPYIWTLESFSNLDDPSNHGYSYLPGLLYLQGPLYVLHIITNIPYQYLWKIPVLLADVGVGIILVRMLYKKNYQAMIAGLLIWFFNPYFYLKNNYVFTDPITVFFMMLALYYLEKDDVLSGALFTMSVIFKTFSVILLPIFILKSKSKPKWLVSAFIVWFFISLPFFRSVDDFLIYIQGSLLIHGERFIQGRPFLFYISYFYDVELFQIIPFKAYTYLATFGSWTAVVIGFFVGRKRNLGVLQNKYLLSLLAFGTFYVFTPVLNRTYLMWVIPVLVLGAYSLFEYKKRILYYATLVAFWLFYYWYLVQWKDGFHIWRP